MSHYKRAKEKRNFQISALLNFYFHKVKELLPLWAMFFYVGNGRKTLTSVENKA
jgi:hypothetical protein